VFPARDANGPRDAVGCGLPGSRLRLTGTFDRGSVAPIRDRLRRLGADRNLLACDVSGVAADLRALDALAQLELAVRRLGGELRIEGVPPALMELALLAGLDDVLSIAGSASAGSDVETRRQPEQREQPLGVEEEHDPPDLAVGDVDDLQ
jgi:ABC-type transporter Mla MlaB component